MSFEGYFQLICKNRHYYIAGLYGEEENTKCRCGEKSIWWNLVNTTNDSGNPIEIKIKSQTICKHCKSVLETIFEIPKGKGHIKKCFYED